MRRSSFLFAITLLIALAPGMRARGLQVTVCESGCTYTNAQLQQAIVEALPGDSILLQAGHTYTGSFKLPAARSCAADDASCYVTIRTGVDAAGALLDETSFPPADVRVSPADAPRLAKLQSDVINGAAVRTVQPGDVGPLCTAAPCVARWWRLARLEILPEPTYQGGALIELGTNGMPNDMPNGDTQDRRSDVPAHFRIEQVYAHGDPVKGQLRGLVIHADDVTLKDSYISDIKSRAEGQAIGITNCAGPLTITNNYLEGNAENVMSGGDSARAAQVQSVLASPAPTTTTARLSATTDLLPGQWISVLVGGVKHSTVVRAIAGNDLVFDALAAAPDAPGAASWGLVPGNMTFTRNHVAKPPEWRAPIVPAPTGVVALASAGGGTLAAGVYFYKVVARREVALNGQAYSAASAEVAATAEEGGSITIRWNAVPDADGYYVYGRAPGAENIRWTVAAPATSFSDTGASGTSATPPAATVWLVKNSFELKAMDGALVEGNVFDYSWKQGQDGYLVLLTVANTGGGNDSTVVRDITFQRNRVRHGAGALQMTAQDVAGCGCQHSGRLERITVRDNVFEDIGNAWGSGIPAMALSGPGTATQPRLGPKDLTIDHNTIVTSGTNKFLNVSLGRDSVDYHVENFTYSNNMTRRSTYGLRYDKSPGGMQAEGITSWTLASEGSSAFVRNVIVDANCSIYPSPEANSCPSSAAWELEFVNFAGGDYRLSDGSIYRGAGTDGKDLGADIAAIDAQASIALTGDNRGTPSEPPPPPPPSIQTTSLPDGGVDIAYSYALAAADGTPPYTWSVTGGSLPPGLALSADGTLAGIPSIAGAFTWTATVADAAGSQDSRTFTAAIVGPLAIVTTSLPDAYFNAPYSAPLQATGGVPPYSWAAGAGLPRGLTLSTGGVLSGKPKATGTFTWTATLADAAGSRVSRTFKLAVLKSNAKAVKRP